MFRVVTRFKGMSFVKNQNTKLCTDGLYPALIYFVAFSTLFFFNCEEIKKFIFKKAQCF